MLRLAFIFVILGCLESTSDLNIHELRLVADHLRYEDCLKLITALHHKEFFVDKDKIEPENSNKSCLYLLLKWDRTEGRGKTFYDLPLRLRQLGHASLAGKLSKIVYHEKALNLKRTFTDDPYKQMIHQDSFILDNDKVKRRVHAEAQGRSSNLTVVFWIACGAVSFLIFLRISLRIFCPGAFTTFWKKLAPDTVKEGCNFCCGEINRFTTRIKKHYKRYVIGIHIEDKVLDEEV